MATGGDIIELEAGYKRVKREGIDPFIEFIEAGEREFFKAKDFVTLYDLLFKMCIQRDPYNWSEAMYEKYTQSIQDYLLTKVQPALNKAQQQYDTAFLKEWTKRWNNHTLIVKGLSKLFMYLDRFYTPNTDNICSLKEQGFKLYKETIFDHFHKYATKAILNAIEKERNNEQQDRHLLQEAVKVYVEMGQNYNNKKLLEIYSRDLERDLIQHAGEHYKRKSREWMDQDSAPVYMEKVEKVLAAEKNRVDTYLNRATLDPLHRECYLQMLKIHQKELLRKKTGIHHLLSIHAVDDLSRMYRLYRGNDVDLDVIAEMLGDHIKKAGTEVVDKARPQQGGGNREDGDEDNPNREVKEKEAQDEKKQPTNADGSSSAASTTTAAVSSADANHALVRNLIALHAQYNEIVTTCFEKAQVMQKALKKAFEEFINKDNRVSKLLAKFVNDVLKKGSKVNVKDIESTLDNVVFLYGYIQEKDVFERDYQLFLANRLLMGLCESEHSEKSMIAKLKTECLSPESKVYLANGKLSTVAHLTVGTELMGDNGRGRRIDWISDRKESADMYEFVLSNGLTIRCTADHSVPLKCVQPRESGVVVGDAAVVSYIRVDRTNYPERKQIQVPLKRSTAREAESSSEKLTHSHEFAQCMRLYSDLLALGPHAALKAGSVVHLRACQYFKWLNSSSSADQVFALYAAPVVECENTSQLALPPLPDRVVGKMSDYCIGLWLGDGWTEYPAIVSLEDEIIHAWKEEGERFGLVMDIRALSSLFDDCLHSPFDAFFCCPTSSSSNPIISALRSIGVYDSKNVDYYIDNEVAPQRRLAVLAGLLDTHGSYNADTKSYQLKLPTKKLLHGAAELARLLNFSVSQVDQVPFDPQRGRSDPFLDGTPPKFIYGVSIQCNINDIPTIVARTRIECPLVHRFTSLVHVIKWRQVSGEYIGFRVSDQGSDNKHFLLEGGVVTHNCGYQWTNKLEGMFKDVQLSKEMMQQFRKLNEVSAVPVGKPPSGGKDKPAPAEDDIQLEVNVCTTGYWPNTKVIPCKMPKDLVLACEKYKRFYLNKHSGHKLEWRFDQGQAELVVDFSKDTRKGLVLSTYQMMILLVFNTVKRVTYKEIVDITGIPKYEIANHLLSLCHPKINVMLKRPNNKKLEDSHQFMLNAGYKNQLKKVNIPLLRTVENEDSGEEENKAIELQRRHQMDAAIVRIMKTRKTLRHNLLVAEVISQLSARFKPKPNDIKKRIEALIEQEYMERDQNERGTYNYLA